MRLSAFNAVVFAAATVLLPSSHAFAHGFAGQRFFPATITTDDPFVADELSLPTVSTFRNPASGDTPETQETDISMDISKRITPNFGIGFGATWQHLEPKGSSAASGFGNLDVGAKYLLLENDPHEFLLSIGVEAEIGGTGSTRVGADRFSTVTPGTLYSAKAWAICRIV